MYIAKQVEDIDKTRRYNRTAVTTEVFIFVTRKRRD